jgi:hypothetical protein
MGMLICARLLGNQSPTKFERHNMKLNISWRSLLLIATLAVMTGCAAVVPMAPKESDSTSKTFKAPAPNMAGVYIYRENTSFGKGSRRRYR